MTFYFQYYIYPLFQMAMMLCEGILLVVLVKTIRKDTIKTNKWLKEINKEIKRANNAKEV